MCDDFTQKSMGSRCGHADWYQLSRVPIGTIKDNNAIGKRSAHHLLDDRILLARRELARPLDQYFFDLSHLSGVVCLRRLLLNRQQFVVAPLLRLLGNIID